ncbi:MAG: DUF308 domain-containing protein [Promethearchaeota archaeon]
MSEMEVPMWIRALDIIIGIIMVVLGLWVIWGIFVPSVLVGLVVMQILGIILLIWGIWQIIKIFMYKEASGVVKILFLLGGLLLIIFGAIAIADPLLTAGLAGLLFAIGLLIYGFLILIAGFMASDAGWQRWLAVVLGIFLVILAAFFLFNWLLAYGTLLIFFAIGLLIGGFVRMVYGFNGSYY